MSRDDYKLTITQAIEEMKHKQGDSFSYSKMNLAELSRMTGISRAKLRRLKENGFSFKPHGRTGKQVKETVLTGYTEILEGCLRSGISNSSVCYDRLREVGYSGSVSVLSRNTETYYPRRDSLLLLKGIADVDLQQPPAKHTRWTGDS